MSKNVNIVFILTDQWRGDCLSITGHPVVQTPNLDALGMRGAVFSSAYSSCPSCIAARASLFTGRAPTSHNRLGYQDAVSWEYDDMLPEVLGRHGYQTHCVGKTHFYPQRKHCGFDSIDSYEGLQNLDGNYVNDYHEWLAEKTNGSLTGFDHGLSSNSFMARPSHLPEELHNNTWVVTKGMEFIRRRDKTRPFFLNLSFHRPHPPIDPPKVYWDMYKDKELPPVPIGDWAEVNDVDIVSINSWCGKLSKSMLNQTRKAYYAQIAHIDNQIGRFLLALSQYDAGPTALVFTSDHGEMLGDHHMFRKTYPYEGSAKVPLVIAMPGNERSGKSKIEHLTDVPVVSEDVYPTILDIAGIEPPEGIDGESLLPVYSGENALGDRQFIHGEHSACYRDDHGMQFLTDGKEKYIWYTSTGDELFFDLESDPNELKNLASEPSVGKRVQLWRGRMVKELFGRDGDQMSDGKILLSGAKLPNVRIFPV